MGLGGTATPGGDHLTTPTMMQVTREPLGTASPEATMGLETSTPAAGGLKTGTPETGGALTTRTPAATPMGTGEATLPDTGLRIQSNPVRISDLLGYTIVDDSGNVVGSVKDMVLDLRTRKIRWVVVSLDNSGASSSGDTAKTVLVPWRALELDLSRAAGPGMFNPAEKSFRLTVTPEVLAAAPTMDLASLNFFAPDFNIQTWDQAQSSYWAQQGGVDVNQGDDLENTGPSTSSGSQSGGAGSSSAQTTPQATPLATQSVTVTETVTATQSSSMPSAGTPSATPASGSNGQGLPGQGLLNNQQGIERMLRASDLMGMPINGQNGDRFAAVNDAIVDARNGRVLFLVLSDIQGLNLSQDLMVVVPMIVFREGTPGQGLLLPFDIARLSDLPSLTQEELNDPNSTVWQDNLWNFWQDLGLPGSAPNGQ